MEQYVLEKLVDEFLLPAQRRVLLSYFKRLNIEGKNKGQVKNLIQRMLKRINKLMLDELL